MPVQVQGRRPRVSRHLSLRLNEEPGGPTEMALWRHLPQEFTSIKTLLLKLKRTLQEDCTAERMATPTESPTDGLPKHSFENSGMSAELLQIRSQLHMRDTEIKTLKERLFAAEIERVRWREGLTSRQDKCTQTDGHTQSRGVFQEPEHSSTCLQCLNQVGYNSPRKETTKMDPPGKTVKEVITGCQIVNKEERKEAIQGPGKTSTTRKISAPTSRLSKLPKHRGSRSEVS
uniref:Uncharacterized protein n=1 Tax=Eptatretus burgeri TaxID=7764 RepID=A0A8C4WYX0_EPTBU